MKKLFQNISYFVILFQVIVNSIEIIRLSFISVPDYLSDYDLSKCTSKHYYHIILNIIKCMIYGMVVFIVGYKDKQEITKDNSLLTLDDTREGNQAIENLNETIMQTHVDNYLIERSRRCCIKDFFIKHKAIISVYLYYFAGFLQLNNPILWLTIPYILYQILFYLYGRCKYYKIFIFPTLLALLNMLLFALYNKNTRVIELEKDVIPDIVLKHFKKDIMVYNISSDKYNIGIINFFGYPILAIFGTTLDLLSKNELISVLYHEIGHMVNSSMVFRLVVTKLLSCIFFVVEFLCIYYNGKIIKRNNENDINERIRNYIKTYVILKIIVSPVFMIVTNIVANIDEMACDKYSVQHYNKEYLKSGLIKLTMENNGFYDLSILYNALYYTHPGLKNRLQAIDNYQK